MRCPSCGYSESKVVDSRPSEHDTTIRRRRECLECGHRFTTYERLVDKPSPSSSRLTAPLKPMTGRSSCEGC